MELASSSDVKVIDVALNTAMTALKVSDGRSKISRHHHAVTGEKRRRKSQIVFKAFR
ncbi:hypothetical protein [Propionispira raffinosivorans]|uniref:hypothetical protein n=1 Tax=Propionispira raffinosivorans TaxID=86959 RepID=UPI001B7F9CAB|nr:hypothetical protein [Propionispira raffinosivorans]